MQSALLRSQIEAALSHRYPSALTVRERSTPEALPTGVAVIDGMTGIGGLPRGALTEICGAASSGRTSVLLSLLAKATGREVCALVDAGDTFDPQSAALAGVKMSCLLWVRCTGSPHSTVRSTQDRNQPRKKRADLSIVEQALNATDLLLQSGGFGLIMVDMGDVSPQMARRVPLTSWFRFRRAVENTPTTLVILEQEPFANSCASLVLRLEGIGTEWARANTAPAHTNLLRTLTVQAKASRVQIGTVRKLAPAQTFSAHASWVAD